MEQKITDGLQDIHIIKLYICHSFVHMSLWPQYLSHVLIMATVFELSLSSSWTWELRWIPVK